MSARWRASAGLRWCGLTGPVRPSARASRSQPAASPSLSTGRPGSASAFPPARKRRRCNVAAVEKTSVDLVRCSWAGSDPLYIRYHDEEWGVPKADSRALFEKLVLEGFQSGLSWITILRKRESFRRAFDGFDPEKIARYGDADVRRLMADPG